MQNKIIFSDIDGTLVFPCRLQDSDEPFGEFHDTHGVRYYALRLHDLIDQIRERNTFHLATARAYSSFVNIKGRIPYDSAALESGCIIIDWEGNIDREYHRKIQDVVGNLDDRGYPQRDSSMQLWAFERYLSELGFITEYRNRFASIRIRAKGNNAVPGGELSLRLMEAHDKKRDDFPDITQTLHEGVVDFHPSAGGKGNYMAHVAKKAGIQAVVDSSGALIRIPETVALGNDPNDLPMLQVSEVPMTLSSSQREVVKYVYAHPNGVLVLGSLYKGSRQMLEHIIHSGG